MNRNWHDARTFFLLFFLILLCFNGEFIFYLSLRVPMQVFYFREQGSEQFHFCANRNFFIVTRLKNSTSEERRSVSLPRLAEVAQYGPSLHNRSLLIYIFVMRPWWRHFLFVAERLSVVSFARSHWISREKYHLFTRPSNFALNYLFIF